MTHNVRRTFAGALIGVSAAAFSASAQTITNPLQNPAPANERGGNTKDNDAVATPRHDLKQNERDAQNSAIQGTNKSGAQQNNNQQPTKSQGSVNAPGSANTQNGNQQQNALSRQSGDHNANNQSTANQGYKSNQGNAGPQANSRDRSQNDRSDRRSSSTAREHTSMKATDMRGPDIGLWFNRGTRDGLVISDVSTRGSIARVGFREGDRLVSVDGHRIATEADFINFLLNSNADRVAVVVTRDGREETIYVQPNTLVEDYGYNEVDPIEQFGVVLDDRYDDRIVVWRVIPRSPAYYAGIREGDVISTLSGRPYTTRRDFETSVRDLRAGETNLQVRRGDRNRDLTVDVPEFERGAKSEAKSENRGAKEREQGARNQSDHDQSNQRDNSDRTSKDRNGSSRSGNQNAPSQPGLTDRNAGGSEHRENR